MVLQKQGKAFVLFALEVWFVSAGKKNKILLHFIFSKRLTAVKSHELLLMITQ